MSRIVIVGGVAGGASCAARLRRLDEQAEIVLIERTPHVSSATCGLPYFVGGVIEAESDLLVATPQGFRERFNVDVRTEHEVVAVHRLEREVEVRTSAGKTYRLQYDSLVLAPGARPIRPADTDLPGVFTLRTVADARAIREWIAQRHAGRAVVVGAGFIGLEMVESLRALHLEVSLLELAPQVLPVLDPELAGEVATVLRREGVSLHLAEGLAAIEPGLVVRTTAGRELPTDLVILALGVRPESELARAAGLEVGPRGGIRVNEEMLTSDPRIWAVGDAVEVTHVVTEQTGLLALAGPAQRQGRVAADSICGRPARFRGVQGTAIVGLFGRTVAMTGASERSLRAAGMQSYAVAYVHSRDHASYYPGSTPLTLKLIFRPYDGKILGAQAVGQHGVDKRIDVLSMAIQKGATVLDLEESELAYAPQFGSAKDPINLAGMVAANVVRGDLSLAAWEEASDGPGLVVDVREPSEFERGHIPHAINLPLSQLRRRMSELPRDRSLLLCCQVGQRAYYAARLLTQTGYQAAVLSGGYRTWQELTA